MLNKGDVVTVTHDRDDFLYYMASVIMEAHPFEVIYNVIGYDNLLLE